MEVVLARGAAGCAARVQGHLYSCSLCPDLGGRGGHVGLPTGWTDFLCRVMPRTGFRDKGVGPRTETLTAKSSYHSLSFLIRSNFFLQVVGKVGCSHLFQKRHLISTDTDAFVHNSVSISWCGICINSVTCRSAMADVPPLHVSGMHQV